MSESMKAVVNATAVTTFCETGLLDAILSGKASELIVTPSTAPVSKTRPALSRSSFRKLLNTSAPVAPAVVDVTALPVAKREEVPVVITPEPAPVVAPVRPAVKATDAVDMTGIKNGDGWVVVNGYRISTREPHTPRQRKYIDHLRDKLRGIGESWAVALLRQTVTNRGDASVYIQRCIDALNARYPVSKSKRGGGGLICCCRVEGCTTGPMVAR